MTCWLVNHTSLVLPPRNGNLGCKWVVRRKTHSQSFTLSYQTYIPHIIRLEKNVPPICYRVSVGFSHATPPCPDAPKFCQLKSWHVGKTKVKREKPFQCHKLHHYHHSNNNNNNNNNNNRCHTILQDRFHYIATNFILLQPICSRVSVEISLSFLFSKHFRYTKWYETIIILEIS